MLLVASALNAGSVFGTTLVYVAGDGVVVVAADRTQYRDGVCSSPIQKSFEVSWVENDTRFRGAVTLRGTQLIPGTIPAGDSLVVTEFVATLLDPVRRRTDEWRGCRKRPDVDHFSDRDLPRAIEECWRDDMVLDPLYVDFVGLEASQNRVRPRCERWVVTSTEVKRDPSFNCDLDAATATRPIVASAGVDTLITRSITGFDRVLLSSDAITKRLTDRRNCITLNPEPCAQAVLSRLMPTFPLVGANACTLAYSLVFSSLQKLCADSKVLSQRIPSQAAADLEAELGPTCRLMSPLVNDNESLKNTWSPTTPPTHEARGALQNVWDSWTRLFAQATKLNLATIEAELNALEHRSPPAKLMREARSCFKQLRESLSVAPGVDPATQVGQACKTFTAGLSQRAVSEIRDLEAIERASNGFTNPLLRPSLEIRFGPGLPKAQQAFDIARALMQYQMKLSTFDLSTPAHLASGDVLEGRCPDVRGQCIDYFVVTRDEVEKKTWRFDGSPCELALPPSGP